MARPKYLRLSVQTRSDGIPSVAWCDHPEFARRGDAVVGPAGRTRCGESSWRGDRIERNVRIDASAFPNVVVLRTVMCGFAFKNQMTNSSTGVARRQKMTWKPRQC